MSKFTKDVAYNIVEIQKQYVCNLTSKHSIGFLVGKKPDHDKYSQVVKKLEAMNNNFVQLLILPPRYPKLVGKVAQKALHKQTNWDGKLYKMILDMQKCMHIPFICKMFSVYFQSDEDTCLISGLLKAIPGFQTFSQAYTSCHYYIDSIQQLHKSKLLNLHPKSDQDPKKYAQLVPSILMVLISLEVR